MVTLIALLMSGSLAVQDARNDYEPNWESLETHPTPEWFEDGKFGIFIHWGVYSVPSFCDTSTYSEWYLHWLDRNAHGGLERRFHEKNYGKDFEYREFAPMFRAEMWDPEEWAEIFRRSGAEYVVLTSKHHDGYCLWPSEEASAARGYPWNSVETGPGRDLVGELMDAVRAKGLHPGLYYSFMEWHNPLYDNDRPRYVDEVMIPQIKDIITRYQPDVFWPDGEWDHPDTLWRSTEILDWIYDNCENPETIVVNDRWGRGLRGQVGDYTTTEYDSLGNSSGKGMRKYRPFEECRGIGHSFAFNRAEGYDIYDSRETSVRKLIDVVSKGGVLLLDVGPTADGRIPLIMVDRLFAIGDWLEVNGEAIKGADRSPFGSLPWGRATTKDDVLYLHVFDWPEDDRLVVPGLTNTITEAVMLGDRVPDRGLVIEREGRWPVIRLDGLHPFDHATVIRCRLDGKPIVDQTIHPDDDGVYRLHAEAATLAGPNIRIESYPGDDGGPESNIGYWNSTDARASWLLTPRPGRYRVRLDHAVADGQDGSVLRMRVGTETLALPLSDSTGAWQSFRPLEAGVVTLPASDKPLEIVLEATEIPGQAAVNIRSITLVPDP